MAAYSDAVIADTPLVYLHLDGNANDASGNSRNFSAHGTPDYNSSYQVPTYHQESGAQALKISSANYVTRAWDSALDIAGAFSTEVWIKAPSSLTLDPYCIAAQYDSSHGGWLIYIWSDGHLTARYNSGSTQYEINSSAGVIVANGSYHIVQTCDSSKHHKLYINDSVVASATEAALMTSVGNIGSGFDHMNVGARDNINSFPAIGFIVDEFAFYNYDLSATQIDNHYTLGTNPATVYVDSATVTNIFTPFIVESADNIESSLIQAKTSISYTESTDYVETSSVSTVTTVSSSDSLTTPFDFPDSATASFITSLSFIEAFGNFDLSMINPITYVVAIESQVHPSGSWGPFDTDDGIFVWP